MTNPIDDDDAAYWALEIERDGQQPEYLSAEAIEADGQHVTIYTSTGNEITLERSRVRKILMMRTAPVPSA